MVHIHINVLMYYYPSHASVWSNRVGHFVFLWLNNLNFVSFDKIWGSNIKNSVLNLNSHTTIILCCIIYCIQLLALYILFAFNLYTYTVHINCIFPFVTLIFISIYLWLVPYLMALYGAYCRSDEHE